MKIRKLLTTLILTTMFSVVAYGEVPYQSLYYDGEIHQYTADKINLNINGVELKESDLPLQPLNLDGARTLVPLREVFESLGARVNFNSVTNTVTILDDNNTVVVTVGSTTGTINGNQVEMDTAPKFVSIDSDSPKKVMIPLRFVGEGLGYEVNYDASTRTVYVNKPNTENPENTENIITNEDTENTENTTNEKEILNAERLTFSTSKDVDLFTLYGTDKSPNLESEPTKNGNTLYIDVLKPNNILNGVSNNLISENVTGVVVNSYKVYDISNTATRIEVNLKKEYVYNVVKNGNLTKIYIKPVAENTVNENNNSNNTENTGNISIENKGVLTFNTTPRTTTVKINKTLANISSDFNTKNILHTDNYMKYIYELALPISLQNVLQNQNYPINNEILKSIDVVNTNGETKFVFNGENVLYASVSEDSENIIFTIKAARDVYDKIIVIDAGHGGTDPGTKGVLNGTTYYEKTVVLDMAKKATEYISVDTRFKVYETRPYDIFVERAPRPAFSSKIQADMFISIHANAAESTVANGIETFYFDVEKEDATYLAGRGVYPNEHRKEVTAESKAFAKVMHENLIQTTLLTDRKYQHKDLEVLRSNEVPSILIETGFMSNQRELINLIDEGYRTKVAKCIADTVIGYYNSY